MNAFCALVAAGAVAIAVWSLVTGRVALEGLDGVFLLVVCALLALVFAAIPMQALRKTSRAKPQEKS